MRQEKLFQPDFSQTIQDFSESTAEDRGAIFTRPEVVDFILDLSGYAIEKDLQRYRILEPSFGDGDFLLPIVNRLLKSYNKTSTSHSNAVHDLTDAVRAFEINHESIRMTTNKLKLLLNANGLQSGVSQTLLDKWIINGDFLLTDLPFTFTHVVGNPPYVRQERIPDILLKEYRERYTTIYDRADLYVPFIEKGLTCLEPNGTIGFICSDRWMKNKYGGPLRAMVSKDFHISGYVDMVDTPAFNSDVVAYPAITIIRRNKDGQTRIASKPQLDQQSLSELSHAMLASKIPKDSQVIETGNIHNGEDPWVFHSLDRLAVVRRLEEIFPAIEDTGCRIGIGVATGADKVFIGPMDSMPVEPDRKIPLVKTKDIEKGTVDWQGLAVINPFGKNGKLVSLANYPKLASYFNSHAQAILKRNCAKKNPKGWYRTIDRICPDLASRPKLLIPDIKGDAHIVYENGQFYPHHNLYYVISDKWNIKALQTVLKSGIAKLFVSVYSTKMRGGYFRFQAQYLRKIRLPYWQDVPESMRKQLINLADSGNIESRNKVVFDLYGLTPIERTAVHK
ncbi:MAG: Eco57I restriction-modification methylase domain-containing protein [Desulfobacterales bacterium]|nr:Eco57I restriction-modification methylase domain-containing protein [Desulfobacterales bacterium]